MRIEGCINPCSKSRTKFIQKDLLGSGSGMNKTVFNLPPPSLFFSLLFFFLFATLILLIHVVTLPSPGLLN